MPNIGAAVCAMVWAGVALANVFGARNLLAIGTALGGERILDKTPFEVLTEHPADQDVFNRAWRSCRTPTVRQSFRHLASTISIGSWISASIYVLYIAGGWLLPGRKRVVPYSIQTFKRLRPKLFRKDLSTLESCHYAHYCAKYAIIGCERERFAF